MDYGAPVGYRMFAADPDRVLGFVIQNGNAYEGLPESWNDIRAYWADPSPANAEKLRAFLTLEGTIWQFTAGTRDRTKISPDNFWHRSEEHTSELQSLMRISNADVCLTKTNEQHVSRLFLETKTL